MIGTEAAVDQVPEVAELAEDPVQSAHAAVAGQQSLDSEGIEREVVLQAERIQQARHRAEVRIVHEVLGQEGELLDQLQVSL